MLITYKKFKYDLYYIYNRGDYMGLRSDIRTVKRKDPASTSTLSIILTANGMHAVWGYRLAHLLWIMHLKLLAKIVSGLGRFFTGVEIHPAAVIGKNFMIDHGTGTVIGETTVIGNNVLIYHQVTLGGTGNESGKKRHPSLCDGVMIAAGAKILGDIKIGAFSRVGANSVVLMDIPSNATAVGIPARIILNEDMTETDCSLMSKL